MKRGEWLATPTLVTGRNLRRFRKIDNFFFPVVSLHLFPQATHGSIKDEADVPDTQFGDVADFLIRMKVLETQAYDFPLIWGEFLHEFHESGDTLLAFHFEGRRRVIGAPRFEFSVLNMNIALLAPKHFKRTIATHREEPLGEMTLYGFLLLLIEAHEGILHDVAGALQISNDTVRVLEEWLFVPLHCSLNPFRFLFLF